MKSFTRLITCILIVLMLPTAGAVSLSLDDVFQGDSCWVMEYIDNEGKVQSVYHVCLMQELHMTRIVDDEGTYYVDQRFDWSFDPENQMLQIDMLKDGWNSGSFILKDGVFVSGGAYHNTRLTCQPNDQQYRDRYQTFTRQYGSRNFASILKKMYMYLDFDLWSDPDFPLETFRYMAMYKTLGVVVGEHGDKYDQAKQDIEPLLGGFLPDNFLVDAVLGYIDMPDENTMNYGWRTEIVNLVYHDPAELRKASESLIVNRKALLSGEVADRYACANDVFSGFGDGNGEDLVTIVEMPCSIFVFRGPKDQVKEIMNALRLGALLEP